MSRPKSSSGERPPSEVVVYFNEQEAAAFAKYHHALGSTSFSRTIKYALSIGYFFENIEMAARLDPIEVRKRLLDAIRSETDPDKLRSARDLYAKALKQKHPSLAKHRLAKPDDPREGG